MPKRITESYMDQVRPFCMFLLTGGVISGTGMLGYDRYWLGVILAAGGCIGALAVAITAKVLHWIEAFEYKNEPRSENFTSATREALKEIVASKNAESKQ